MAFEARETIDLIASDKVEGTSVYDAEDKKIGTIARVVIEKTSGQVVYAVVGFGGFLGIGDAYYPLPWHSLTYDTELGGYLTSVTTDQLQAAPKYDTESNWSWSDPARSKAVDEYYPFVSPQQNDPSGFKRAIL